MWQQMKRILMKSRIKMNTETNKIRLQMGLRRIKMIKIVIISQIKISVAMIVKIHKT